MTSYVIAGYMLVSGALALYAGRLVIRARQVAKQVLEIERHREDV